MRRRNCWASGCRRCPRHYGRVEASSGRQLAVRRQRKRRSDRGRAHPGPCRKSVERSRRIADISGGRRVCDTGTLRTPRSIRPLSLRQLWTRDLARLRVRGCAAAWCGTALRDPPFRGRQTAGGPSSVLCLVEREAGGARIQMPSWQDALGRYVKSLVASR